MSKNNEIQKKSKHKIAFATTWQKCTYDILAFNWQLTLHENLYGLDIYVYKN